jgi:hypothetical protein
LHWSNRYLDHPNQTPILVFLKKSKIEYKTWISRHKFVHIKE